MQKTVLIKSIFLMILSLVMMSAQAQTGLNFQGWQEQLII